MALTLIKKLGRIDECGEYENKLQINIMLSASSQKKIIRSKQSHDLTNAPESRMMHVRSQQNLLQKTIVDEVKLQQNILKDIEQTKQAISKYNSEIQAKTPSVNPPPSTHQCVVSLYDLEKIIEAKNAEINSISEEIKGLKSSPNQIYKEFNIKYKTIKNMQLYKLSEEISQQKDELFKLQKQHQKKKKQLHQNRKIMKQTVESHTNITNGSKRIMSYQEFISKRKDRERQEPEESNHKSKRLSKKNVINIKEATESDEQKKKLVFINSNNLTEVENKRRVAETALRVAKKKHQDLLNELNSKLQFLRDENQQLDEALDKKSQELKDAQMKFSQKQQHSQPKKILKVVRYSEPEL